MIAVIAVIAAILAALHLHFFLFSHSPLLLILNPYPHMGMSKATRMPSIALPFKQHIAAYVLVINHRSFLSVKVRRPFRVAGVIEEARYLRWGDAANGEGRYAGFWEESDLFGLDACGGDSS